MKHLVTLSEPYRISALLQSFVENLQQGPSCPCFVHVTPFRNCPLIPRSFSSAEGSVQHRSCAESELTLLPPFCSVVSPIDGKSMESITSVKIFHGSEYKANGKVIRWTEVGPSARHWGWDCVHLHPPSAQESSKCFTTSLWCLPYLHRELPGGILWDKTSSHCCNRSPRCTGHCCSHQGVQHGGTTATLAVLHTGTVGFICLCVKSCLSTWRQILI